MIRNVKLILMLLAFLPLCAIAQGNWNDALYKQIEQNVKEPVFKDKTYDVTKYGASVNATAAKNQKAINKAIEACSKAGGGKVVIPAAHIIPEHYVSRATSTSRYRKTPSCSSSSTRSCIRWLRPAGKAWTA